MQSGTTPPRELIINLIKGYLHSPESSWSNGISGAIAEFMYDAGETVSFGETANRSSCADGSRRHRRQTA